MLSFAHLIDANACPTCPTLENEVGQPVSQEMAGVSPTCPTCPTKKQAVREELAAGTERPWHCPQQERKWLVVPGTPCSECRACGRHRCFMLTEDTKGGAE